VTLKKILSFIFSECLLNTCLRLVWHQWSCCIEQKMSQILVGILCSLQITMYYYQVGERVCFLSKIKRSWEIRQYNMFKFICTCNSQFTTSPSRNYIKLSYFQTLCIPQYMNKKTWYQSFYRCSKWVNQYQYINRILSNLKKDISVSSYSTSQITQQNRPNKSTKHNNFNKITAKVST